MCAINENQCQTHTIGQTPNQTPKPDTKQTQTTHVLVQSTNVHHMMIVSCARWKLHIALHSESSMFQFCNPRVHSLMLSYPFVHFGLTSNHCAWQNMLKKVSLTLEKITCLLLASIGLTYVQVMLHRIGVDECIVKTLPFRAIRRPWIAAPILNNTPGMERRLICTSYVSSESSPRNMSKCA